MPTIELKNVRRDFGAGAHRAKVLDGINLTIEEGEFVAIVGYSGTGKSTLVNLMAGLLKPTSGEVLYRGTRVAGPSPERAVVFQNYSLLPWLSVEGNVALAVNHIFKRESAKERAARVDHYIGMVGLSDDPLTGRGSAFIPRIICGLAE